MTLLLICALALQDPLAIRLSPEYRATRAPIIAKELGDKAGIRLQVEPRFTNEVLILRAKDITLKELMVRIADVCDAGWVRSEEGYTLKRAAHKQRELEQLDIRLREEAIQKVLDAEAKTLARWDTPEKRAKAFTQGYEMAVRLSEQGNNDMFSMGAYYGPGHQFYLKMIAAIGARNIASLPIGARVDFANSPNLAQRPLPAQYGELLKEFNETAEAVRANYDERPPAGMPDYAFDLSIKHLLRPFEVRKTIFALTHDHWAAWAYMGMYDAKGDMITNSTGLRVMFTFPAAPYQAQVPLEAVEYGDAAREFEACYPSIASEDIIPMDKTMSDEGRRLLLNPEKHDPLAYHISDAFEGLASQTGMMIVGRLQDDLWRALPIRKRPQPIDLNSFLATAAHHGLKLSERDGWLTGKLTNPAHFERTRLNRLSFGRLLRTSWENKKFDLESCCRFEYEHDAYAYLVSPFNQYRKVMIGLGVRPAFGHGFFPPRLMAACGTLGAEQWRQLRSGEPLRLNTLSTLQKAAFAKIVPVASPQEGFDPTKRPPKIMMHVSMALPFGPGPDTFLHFTPDVEMLTLGGVEGYLAPYPVNADSLGNFLASKAVESGHDQLTLAAPKELRYGSRRGYKWEIQLIPGIAYGPAELYERAEFEAKPRKYNDLPAEFRTEVAKKFQEYIPYYKKGGGS